jgi:hypothetical protein
LSGSFGVAASTCTIPCMPASRWPPMVQKY